MEVSFFDALAVIALGIGQAKETLLEELAARVSGGQSWLSIHILLFIPEAESNILPAVRIGDAGNAVFAPTESSRSGVFVWKVCERLAWSATCRRGYVQLQASPSWL